MASTGAGGTRGERPLRILETAAPTIGKVTNAAPPGLPEFDLDRQPAVRGEAGRLGALWVQACSVAGRGHVEGPNPSSGQDSYSYRLSDDGAVAVIAVADGLGSRPRSHVGARTAAVEACAQFCDPAVRHLLDGPIGRVAADRAVLAAMDRVQRRLHDVGTDGGTDVATTLLVAIVGLGTRQPRATFIRVGDPSALLMLDGRFTDRSLVFGAPAPGAANAVSACLPMRSPEREVEVVRVGDLPDGVAVVLVTDGVGNDLAGSAELRQWFEQRWAEPLDAAGMIDTLRYRRQGSVDDRTAVVVYATPVGAGAPATDRQLPRPIVSPPAAVPPSGRRSATPPPKRRSSAPLVALGVAGLVVAIGAVAVVAMGSGSGGDGDTAAVPLVQSAGPGAAASSILVPEAAAGAARAVAVDGAAIGADRVITASGGQLVAVDGCLETYQVAEPLAPEQRDLSCTEPLTPTLVAPVGDALVVVQGGDVHVLSGDSRSNVAATTDPLVATAVDVTSAGDVLVFAGPSGVATLAAGSDVVAVDALDAALASPAGGCSEPVYRSVEDTGDGRVAVAATCVGGGWAIAAFEPQADAVPCVALVGDGPVPVPFRTGEGSLALAVPAFGADGAVVTADVDDAACRNGG